MGLMFGKVMSWERDIDSKVYKFINLIRNLNFLTQIKFSKKYLTKFQITSITQ